MGKVPAIETEATETRELQEGQGKGQPFVDVRSGGGVSLSSRGCSGSPRAYRWLEPQSHRPQSTVSSPRVVAAGFRAQAPLTLHRSE